KIISGGKTEVGVSLTDIETENTVFDYGRIKKGTKNMSVFKIKNTGNNPLIINRVTASCGCTHVSWDKHPIEPDNTATVTVEMTPEETGRFSKTLDVYCNATTSPVRLTVTGEVIENK
ncbi:MAG: DUF1573 domain-containing protein, partial [Dysgonamonadaceae bacterium]|nr:DUF1573 domain-containing protein [Dysgonamonadaceae bacterium]